MIIVAIIIRLFVAVGSWWANVFSRSPVGRLVATDSLSAEMMLPHVLMPVLGRDKALSSHFLVANLIGGADSPEDSEREEHHSEQEDKDWHGE